MPAYLPAQIGHAGCFLSVSYAALSSDCYLMRSCLTNSYDMVIPHVIKRIQITNDQYHDTLLRHAVKSRINISFSKVYSLNWLTTVFPTYAQVWFRISLKAVRNAYMTANSRICATQLLPWIRSFVIDRSKRGILEVEYTMIVLQHNANSNAPAVFNLVPDRLFFMVHITAIS